MSRRAQRITVVAAGLAVVPVVAACGAGRTAAHSSTAATPLQLTAGVATCAPSTTERTCEVTVSYQNGSSSPVHVEPGSTLLVDSRGDVHRGVATPELTQPLDVAPGDKVSIVWTATVPSDALVTRVTYVDGAGVGTVLQVSAVVSGRPTPAPTQPPAPEPVSVATPTAAPVPTKAKPSPSATRTRTRQPTPSPTSVGSIG